MPQIYVQYHHNKPGEEQNSSELSFLTEELEAKGSPKPTVADLIKAYRAADPLFRSTTIKLSLHLPIGFTRSTARLNEACFVAGDASDTLALDCAVSALGSYGSSVVQPLIITTLNVVLYVTYQAAWATEVNSHFQSDGTCRVSALISVDNLIMSEQILRALRLTNDTRQLSLHLPDGITKSRSGLPQACFADSDASGTSLNYFCKLAELKRIGSDLNHPLVIKSAGSTGNRKWCNLY